MTIKKTIESFSLALKPGAGNTLFEAAREAILQQKTQQVVSEVSAKLLKIEQLREVVKRSNAAIKFYENQLEAIRNSKFTIEKDYTGYEHIQYHNSSLNGHGPEHGGA